MRTITIRKLTGNNHLIKGLTEKDIITILRETNTSVKIIDYDDSIIVSGNLREVFITMYLNHVMLEPVDTTGKGIITLVVED